MLCHSSHPAADVGVYPLSEFYHPGCFMPWSMPCHKDCVGPAGRNFLAVMCLHRCFPRFPDEFTSTVYSMVDTGSDVFSNITSTVKDQFTATAPQFTSYIADISKGILIIVVGGLACGVVLSLVSSLADWELSL